MKFSGKGMAHGIFLILLCALAASFSFLPPGLVIGLMVLVGIGLTTVTEHDYFFYALVALVPCVGLVLSLKNIPGIAVLPVVGSWDAPIADFLALPLIALYAVKILCEDRVVKLHHHIRDHLPGIAWYAPFLCIAFLTIFRAPPAMHDASVHYFIRFVLFSYIAYVALPFWAITSKKILTTTLRVIAWSTIAIALFGVASLIINPPFWGMWHQVSPFVIGIFAPLGTNHNLIAEVLIYGIPFVWLASRETEGMRHKWYVIALWLVVITVLLTFARTAWIALLAQCLLVARLVRPQHLLNRAVAWWPVLLLGSGLLIYMTMFSGSDYVHSSTLTRIDLTRIALQQASITPWFGKGIGTFLPTLGETRAFIVDYGAPIEAHGFIQKLLFETGIIGLSLFVLFFGWLFVTLIRRWHSLPAGSYRDMVLAVLVSTAGAFVYQVFNVSYFSPKLWLPVGLSLVILFGKWKFKNDV